MIPIPDPANLPMEYRLTLNGRQARVREPDNPALHDRFLLFNQGGLMIFTSDLDLRVLHQSQFWISDGTFEMRPRICAQVYTIHTFIGTEGITL